MKKLGYAELVEVNESAVTYKLPEYVDEMYLDNRIANIAADLAESICLAAEQTLEPETKGKVWEIVVRPLGRSDWMLPYKHSRVGDSRKILTEYIKKLIGIKSCVKTNCGLRGDEILGIRLSDRNRKEIEIKLRGDSGIQKELWGSTSTTVAYPRFLTVHF